MAKKKASSRKSDKSTTAILGLIINLFFPGVGSLIGGKTKEGTIQLILWILAIIFIASIIGIVLGWLLYVITWIWALITSIQMVKETS